MNNNGWITDRLPTLNDTHGTCDCVWVTWSRGNCGPRSWMNVEKDQPWQPLTKPEPYDKSKRWSVDWNHYGNSYEITDGEWRIQLEVVQSKDAAQRICDIYNEVMP